MTHTYAMVIPRYQDGYHIRCVTKLVLTTVVYEYIRTYIYIYTAVDCYILLLPMYLCMYSDVHARTIDKTSYLYEYIDCVCPFLCVCIVDITNMCYIWIADINSVTLLYNCKYEYNRFFKWNEKNIISKCLYVCVGMSVSTKTSSSLSLSLPLCVSVWTDQQTDVTELLVRATFAHLQASFTLHVKESNISEKFPNC